MIYHGNRIKLKEGISQEQIEQALEIIHEQGRTIPAVKSYFVGREYGGAFEWNAFFVLEDLEAYEEYLNHPAHTASERFALPLLEKFEAYDITDDPDPGFGAEVARLQRRHYAADPELVRLVSALPSHTGSSALPDLAPEV
ncbi:Dabb family protein [Streptomyces corynorhini]|uniref:Dabb family protein n=1 Tax=Streptomyces corynorhini TaxID=2282652 RepID=A0A370BGH6_9ACTN|nr:Dabb family protein [Streptomyces corynorhini]RDG38776.1 Dabb family protein [Streptomyces corynorhini]